MKKPVKKGVSSLGIMFINLLFLILLLTIVLAVDTTPPLINSISASPNPLSASDLLTITANVTDDILVKSVLVEINATNYSMQRAADNNTLLYDDFESRNLSNWTTSGAGAAWKNTSINPFSGTSHIRAEPQNLGGSFIETNITTLGYANIDFSFYAATNGLDVGDTFQVDWNYGSGWVNLLTTHASGSDEFSGITSYKFFGFSFNDSADNKNNISVRFVCIAGGINEVCDVDNVTVTKNVVTQKAIFDDFESRNLSNWTTSGAGAAWTNTSINPFSGTSHIRAEPQNLGGSFIETNITTLGYANIDFSFYAATNGLDAGDTFQVDWNYGSGWVNLLTTHASGSDEFSGVTSYKFFGFSFNDSADNKNNISVRFVCIAGGINEVCDVDNVSVTKIPFGDLWSFVYNTTGLSGGLHNYTVYSNDSSGNSAVPQKSNFTIISVDTTPPGVNITNFNSSDTIRINNRLNISCQSFDSATTGNITFNLSGPTNLYDFSFTLTGTSANFSQNITVNLTRGSVINATCWARDSAGNVAQNSTLITVANTPAGQATIVFPTNDLKTNIQPLDLNVTFSADPDNEVINISYYINGRLNQTQLANTTFNASDGVYILNVSLHDNVTAITYSANVTVNFTVDTTRPVVNTSLNKSLTNINQNDIINITANVTDGVGLSFCQFIDNQSLANGAKTYFNISVSGTSAQCSQNYTIRLSDGNVINFTVVVNDTSNNFRTNDTIITVASAAADITPPAINITNINASDTITFGKNLNISAFITGSATTANITFNLTGNNDLYNFSFSLSGDTQVISQNITVNLTRGNVINASVVACDSVPNCAINSTLITVSNTPPTAPTILYPTELLNTSQQPLNLNVTFGADADSDIITIYYYINNKLNQTSLSNVTLNASSGSYILNVSLYDSIDFSANKTVSFTIDTITTTVLLDKPDSNYYNDTDLSVNIIFNGTATDNLALKNATLYHNVSGIWRSNLSTNLNGTSARFEFNLNLTNATFIWNVEVCDYAQNCNFSTSNRTITLNFTVTSNATPLSVINFTPANNSLNVSLKQDITATFNQDANDSTIDNSTVIVKDSSNNAVRGKIKYFSSERKVRFNPHRFLKENETYTVNLTKDIKSDNGTSLDSDFIWSFTTEIKDTDKDGIFDIDDIDEDNDNINDTEDFLKGNVSNIKTDIVGLSIEVNESTNLSKKFDKQELVKFLVNDSIVIEFNFSFGQGALLDLTNISVQQNDNSSKGSIIINSLIINATLKTFYLDNLSNYDGICIKDADIDAISDMSNDCKSAFETFVACPGNAKNYDCLINGTRLKLTGLNHSGVQQSNDNAPPRIDLMSISYSGTSTVSATLTVITDEDANCKFDAIDVSFSNMGSSMSGSGTQHTGSSSYSTDTSGNYYVLCRDNFGNTMPSSNSISFNADVTESSGSGAAGGGSGSGGGGNFLNFSICKENWVCDNWNECKNEFQTRKCFDLNNCGTKNQRPKEFQSCKKACEEIWQCSQWSICSDGVNKRECYDLGECGTEDLKPSDYEECEFIAECYNLVQDQGEEGIDCGGACPACENCFDRVQNQGEEGIDCGSPCRPCRTGDVLTGKNILVFSETAPKANLIFIFAIVIFLLFVIFKKLSAFKKVFNKNKETINNKDEIVSKLKDTYGIDKMKPLTVGKPKKIHTYETKKGKIEEIKAKTYKTAATGSSKDKILNVLKDVHQNGR